IASDAEIPLPGRSGDWSASAVTTATITASPPKSRSTRVMGNLRSFSCILGTRRPVKRWNGKQFAALAGLANCLGQRGDAFVELVVLDQNRWQEPDHGPAAWQDEDAPLLHCLDRGPRGSAAARDRERAFENALRHWPRGYEAFHPRAP